MSDQEPGDVAVRLEGITKRFGSVVANDDVDFELEDGTVHALLGENGSGKTTLMSVLYGLYDQDEGTIVVDGEPRTFESPRDAIDAGVGMIHQHFQLVEPMTVLQNIVLGHEPTRFGVVDEERAAAKIEDICTRYDFDIDRFLNVPVEDVDLGDRQRVEIVKSLYRGAEILVLDEPTAVLTPQEVDGMFELMRELTAQGTSLIFITHKLEEAMEIADEITVLRDGVKIGTVEGSETSKEELARMMVGREVMFDYEKRESSTGDYVLDVDGLSVSDDRNVQRVNDVSFRVREGEILGIAGVKGNGQSELVQVLNGLGDVDDGTIRFRGRDITDISRREAIEAGIALIPEDRHREGIVLDYDLVKNALLGFQTIEPYSQDGVINWSAVEDHADGVIEEYDVMPPDRTKLARSFSGGNQQKFIVGRELSHNPDLLVASQPTRGVDIGSIEFIHNRLLEMRDAGMPIVLVSSKLEEIQKLADRIAVMYEGEIVATVPPGEVTEQDLGLLMAGHVPDGIDRTAAKERDGGNLRE